MAHITRDEAYKLLTKYNKDWFHIQHALTVETVMKWYAKKYKERRKNIKFRKKAEKKV